MVATIRARYRKFIDLPTRITGPRKVKVGFPAGRAKGSVIERAVYNEFGTAGGASGGGWGGPVPERPFMRNTMRGNRSSYQTLMRAAARRLVRGEIDLRAVMSRLGIQVQGDIQEEITSLRSPPNSALTVERKGSSNPLIDSGEMRAAVTWKTE